MLQKKLKDYHIILASGSPRRQRFFTDFDINFTIEVREVDEVFPDHLQAEEITDYLAVLKANAFTNLQDKDILITSDTIVWHQNKAIGKPKDKEEARKMIASLSDTSHYVFTSVCFKTIHSIKVIHQKTKVTFKKLSEEEIQYYVDTFSPLDKAGAYGIQDWIGLIGIKKIEGDFYNVMGLPTSLVYETLTAMVTS